MLLATLVRGYAALGVAIVLALIGVGPPAAAIEVSQVAIDRGVGQGAGVGSWFVEISVSGTDIQSAVLTSQTGFDITLGPSATPGELTGGSQFADLQALTDAFPLGSWTLDLNGGALVGSLSYNPLVNPNGSAPISSPVFGENDIALSPTMFFANQCSNCELYSGMTGFGETALLGRLAQPESFQPIETIAVGQSTTQIGFANPLLPGTLYRFETSVATNNYTLASFGVDSFDYYQLATQTESTDFMTSPVPEPGTGLLVGIGLLGLAARRRSTAAA